jgi:endoglucanase
MQTLRRLLPLAIITATLLIAPAARAADPLDLAGFRLQSPVLTVHEHDRVATITVERTNTLDRAYIRYIAQPITAVRYQDFVPVKAMLTFEPGQTSATFNVPIIDHGMPAIPRTVQISLFGPYPIGLGAPSTAVLTIINDDPVAIVRDALNPLALTPVPPPSNPLLGAKPFIDWKWGLAARQERAWAHSRPKAAAMLHVIASQPEDHRFGSWSPADASVQVAQYLERAASEEPGTVPMFSTYWLQNDRCRQWSDPASRAQAYHNWIRTLAAGVGGYRAILFLEMDSVITFPCLSGQGQKVRTAELADAINVLSQVPRLVVYVDAGAADALPARVTARILNAIGVRKIRGFFLNSTHSDWTRNEVRYGERISRSTGGAHFVVNTSSNGRGPLPTAHPATQGNEVICNPPGRGLGPKPTFNTGFANVDAFAWIGNPGKSGGRCRAGAPPTGVFWPQMALDLVRYADFRVR